MTKKTIFKKGIITLAGVIALSGVVQAPAIGIATPKAAAASTVQSTQLSKLITKGKTQLGVKWRSGVQKPGYGFDCSNFTSWVYSSTLGIKFSSASRTQRYSSSIGKQVIVDSKNKYKNLKVGDLLFFKNSADPGDGSLNRSTSGGGGHVGIYAGVVNGKHYILQAGGGRAKVTYEPMEGTWFAKSLVYAKRIVN
ncbi:NlpC/P60 family protein [Paenibacillus glycanilyticus]|uniref:C40 family peptidase n=1 Tax=Paenibacillus glycanilyticus TaxID=126569 RepID=UPI0020410B5E|nr:NlpC/P60 family protein [Paenibacillus glycanilyticus]MCM3626328.1 NlpC/P60 family protein [Paenibacillus glycanilyticus]